VNSFVEKLLLGFLFLLSLLITACDKQEPQKIKHNTQQQSLSKERKQECQRIKSMPHKYRMDKYRAPTPACVPHGITINTDELTKLLKQQPRPILIDVLSVMSRPNTEFGEGQWIPNKERLSLLNSVWLPNVGYGYLDAEMDEYFKNQLEKLTLNKKHKALVFFCIADCWMSWNAVQRAHSYGYTNVYWYKNGTDGWGNMGLELQKIDPIPML